MDKPDLGRLIWANVDDPQGEPAGEHAVIVLTTNDEFEAGEPIIAIVVSSKMQYAKKEDMVPLPFSTVRGGHPTTKLTRACAAICTWMVQVEEEEIRRYGGRVYGEILQ